MPFRLPKLIQATAALFFLVSCGGGASNLSRAGTVRIRVTWPRRGRLIPAASNSIQVVLLRGQAQVASAIIPRPASGDQATATLNGVKVGSLTLTASAYPNADATGVPQASGSTPITVNSGQTTNVTLTMDSTIDHIDLSPSSPSVTVGQAVTLTATARDLAGQIVLMSAGKLSWSTSGAAATVDANGVVTGQSSGSATISVTDQESGKSASVTVTVVGHVQYFVIHGVTYKTSVPLETLTATFTVPDGGVSVNSYSGYVLLHVTGTGQSYANVYNDCFYLYTGPFNPPVNGHDGGYYQLAWDWRTLNFNDLARNAKNFLVDPLPPYSPAHDYTFILDTQLTGAQQLHFGVSDGGFNDNTGAYTITVTQLVPGP